MTTLKRDARGRFVKRKRGANPHTPMRARLSAATMIKRYGDRALEVASRTRELSHTTSQREHWNKVIEQLEKMPGARPGRVGNPGLTLKVALEGGPPIALFRSIGRAKQYAKALAAHTGKRVRLFNPSGRPHKRKGATTRRALKLNPSRYHGASGKYHVVALVKGRRAYLGWNDERLETRREDALGFSTKVVAVSEARRMARRWPEYRWYVQKP